MDPLDAKLAGMLLGGRLPEGRTPTGRRRSDRERWARTIFAPLRSWSLTLRAADSRIAPGAPVELDLPFAGQAEQMQITGIEVRWLCAPVRIGGDGMAICDAMKELGIGYRAVENWTRRGLLRKQRFFRGRTIKGDEEDLRYWPFERRRRRVRGKTLPLTQRTLVTTNGWVDPGGEVQCGPWGSVRRGIVERVDEEWEQQLIRVERRDGRRNPVKMWLCPGGCGRFAMKLYWPMRAMTAARWLGIGDESENREPGDGDPRALERRERFLCRRCAGVVYESSDGSARWGQGAAVNAWDRFLRRLSDGRLGMRELGEEGELKVEG